MSKQTILNSIIEIRSGNIFFGSDFDGCLLPVHTDADGHLIDPRRDVVAIALRDAIAEHAMRYPGSFGIVTGRGLFNEMLYFMAGVKTEAGLDGLQMDKPDHFNAQIADLVEQADFPNGADGFGAMIAQMPIMVASGNEFHYDGKSYVAPTPENQIISLQYALTVGKLCEELSETIAQLDPDYQELKDIFKFLYFRTQEGEFNINTQKAPEKYQQAVVKSVATLLAQTQQNIDIPAGKVIEIFVGSLKQLTDIDVPANLLDHLNAANQNFCYNGNQTVKPLAIENDAAGTVQKIKTVTDKGQNFIHWLQSGLFTLGNQQKITVISDNLQPGGSDRGLVDALINAGYGPRLHIWQTLDSDPAKPKAAIADDDHFAPYRQFLFQHSSNLAAFFTAATNSPDLKPIDLAEKIARGHFKGVQYVGPDTSTVAPAPASKMQPG